MKNLRELDYHYWLVLVARSICAESDCKQVYDTLSMRNKVFSIGSVLYLYYNIKQYLLIITFFIFNPWSLLLASEAQHIKL
jgi:hypothetical protein